MVSQKLKYIFISFIIALVPLQGFDMIQVARAGTIADMELGLSVLINTARTDPLGTATSLGLNPQQVLEDLPELTEILTQGLPPFENNALLHEAASNHTQDMLTQNYFSKISLDGRSPYDRIAETGYDPNITGETLGILAFYNFIGSETAVNILFKNMFLDELNPERAEPRNILNPEIQDMGIGIGTGIMDLGAGRYNVYVVTCDFATSGVSLLELELLELINQARENPLGMAGFLGLAPDQTLENLSELRDILIQGLPPLIFDNNLYQAASGHRKDMIEKGYFSKQSLDGATPQDRILETEYDPDVTGEAIGSMVSSSYLLKKDMAFRIFASLFKAELDPGSKTERKILNGAFKDAGISFDAFQFQQEGDGFATYGLVVVDLGKKRFPVKPCLTGVVYRDANGDGLYSLGEGIPNANVTVGGSDAYFSVVTHMAGGFTLELDPGRYIVTIDQNGDISERVIEIRDENMGIWFKVNPDENVPD